MKAKIIALVSILLLVTILVSPTMIPTVEGQDVSDIKVLMLITDGFGWNYFDAKEILESWGVNVTTIANSLDTEVPACFNREPRWTTADLLLNSVEYDIISQFDALYIPSGGQWQSLIGSTRVLNFISYAYDHGAIVATTCIGNRVLSSANGVVNGTSVVNYANTATYMSAAGAEIRYGFQTVADNRIITGDSGGGPTGGGYVLAPTSEICLDIVREVMGYSYLGEVQIQPAAASPGTVFEITAEVTDLDAELGDLYNVDLNITQVQARILSNNNRTLIDTIPLTDDDENMVYSATYNSTREGQFLVDIEIEDSNSSLVIEREAASFTVGLHSIPLLPTEYIIISGATITIIAIVVVIAAKRR